MAMGKVIENRDDCPYPVLVGEGNSDEVVSLEGCATDKTSVDILLGEEFLCV